MIDNDDQVEIDDEVSSREDNVTLVDFVIEKHKNILYINTHGEGFDFGMLFGNDFVRKEMKKIIKKKSQMITKAIIL